MYQLGTGNHFSGMTSVDILGRISVEELREICGKVFGSPDEYARDLAATIRRLLLAIASGRAREVVSNVALALMMHGHVVTEGTTVKCRLCKTTLGQTGLDMPTLVNRIVEHFALEHGETLVREAVTVTKQTVQLESTQSP